MKPHQLIPVALLVFLTSSAWIITILYNTAWYVEHISNQTLMIIIIALALAMLFSSVIFILDWFDSK